MNRTGKRILFIVLGIITFLAFYSTTFAAPTFKYESNWSVSVDFVGDQPNATLLVEVWKYDGNTNALLNTFSETRPLNCTLGKGVHIIGAEAHFTGGGGIECAMPSIKEMVKNMTSGEYTPPEECTCKSGAVVSSDVEITPNLSKHDRENPIAIMDDIQFSSPVLAYSSARSKLNMTVDTVTAVSTYYVPQTPNNLVNGTFTQINPPAANVYTYVNAFNANGLFLTAAPDVVNAPLFISNNQPTLHIGFNPLTNQGLYGVMAQLFVDPGCAGNGGSGGV